MTKPEFKPIMTMIKGAYGGKFHTLTAEVMDTWYSCLSDLDGSRLEEAAAQYIKANQFPPSISDLRTVYKSLPAAEPDEFDRFKGLAPETVKELMGLGIITEDAGIDLYYATPEQIRLLQEVGAL